MRTSIQWQKAVRNTLVNKTGQRSCYVLDICFDRNIFTNSILSVQSKMERSHYCCLVSYRTSIAWKDIEYRFDTKTLVTNKCTKRVLSSIVTHSYVFRTCCVIFRENFFVIVALMLHFIVEWECENSLRSRLAGRDRREFTPPVHSTPSTAHSHSTVKCNLSVTITKSSPWRWPSRVETCRSVLKLMIKFSLCICWWAVFLLGLI
jgi:hypothetical protein